MKLLCLGKTWKTTVHTPRIIWAVTDCVAVFGLHPTHRFPNSDHAQQLHNVGVSELAIDGRLLQEPDSILLRCPWLQHLHCHLHCCLLALPHSTVHSAKLT